MSYVLSDPPGGHTMTSVTDRAEYVKRFVEICTILHITDIPTAYAVIYDTFLMVYGKEMELKEIIGASDNLMAKTVNYCTAFSLILSILDHRYTTCQMPTIDLSKLLSVTDIRGVEYFALLFKVLKIGEFERKPGSSLLLDKVKSLKQSFDIGCTMFQKFDFLWDIAVRWTTPTGRYQSLLHQQHHQEMLKEWRRQLFKFGWHCFITAKATIYGSAADMGTSATLLVAVIYFLITHNKLWLCDMEMMSPPPANKKAHMQTWLHKLSAYTRCPYADVQAVLLRLEKFIAEVVSTGKLLGDFTVGTTSKAFIEGASALTAASLEHNSGVLAELYATDHVRSIFHLDERFFLNAILREKIIGLLPRNAPLPGATLIQGQVPPPPMPPTVNPHHYGKSTASTNRSTAESMASTFFAADALLNSQSIDGPPDLRNGRQPNHNVDLSPLEEPGGRWVSARVTTARAGLDNIPLPPPVIRSTGRDAAWIASSVVGTRVKMEVEPSRHRMRHSKHGEDGDYITRKRSSPGSSPSLTSARAASEVSAWLRARTRRFVNPMDRSEAPVMSRELIAYLEASGMDNVTSATAAASPQHVFQAMLYRLAIRSSPSASHTGQPGHTNLESGVRLTELQAQGVALFFDSLEGVLRGEEKRLATKKFKHLFANDFFIRSLMACCMEIVLFIRHMPQLCFPHVTGACEVDSFYFIQVVQSFVLSMGHDLPSSLRLHLQEVEDNILSHAAWKNGSALHHLLHSESSMGMMNRPPTKKRLEVFLRKVLVYISSRAVALCSSLHLSELEENLVWTTVLLALSHSQLLLSPTTPDSSSLMSGSPFTESRHIDTVLLCVIYGVCKMNCLSVTRDVTFSRLLQTYRESFHRGLPEVDDVIARRVPLRSDGKTGDIIAFYHGVFLPVMRPGLERLKIVGSDRNTVFPKLSLVDSSSSLLLLLISSCQRSRHEGEGAVPDLARGTPAIHIPLERMYRHSVKETPAFSGQAMSGTNATVAHVKSDEEAQFVIPGFVVTRNEKKRSMAMRFQEIIGPLSPESTASAGTAGSLATGLATGRLDVPSGVTSPKGLSCLSIEDLIKVSPSSAKLLLSPPTSPHVLEPPTKRQRWV